MHEVLHLLRQVDFIKLLSAFKKNHKVRVNVNFFKKVEEIKRGKVSNNRGVPWFEVCAYYTL